MTLAFVLAAAVTVACGTGSRTVEIAPPDVVRVTGEPMKAMKTKDAKVYPWTRQVTDPDPLHWGWVAGSRPKRYRACECTVRHSLVPETLVVRKQDGTVCEAGRDYELESTWGAVARLPGGRIGKDETVLLDYSCRMRRLDLVYLDADGKMKVRRGEPAPVMPVAPSARPGETKVATVWVDPQDKAVTEKNVFYVTEERYPEKTYAAGAWPAERLLPKTLAKLRSGGTLRILAWGDSVTNGSYLPERDRWQHQFVARLRKAYPKASILLESRGWSGKSSGTFLSTNAAPAGVGHPFNYRERILGSDADLVVMEFVNDNGMSRELVFERYGKILADFRAAGKEWCILTPHYTREDWMGFASQQNIDEDPRVYVKAVRTFCAEKGVALADAASRWGRLYRQGIPYESLLVNAINHPNRQGMGYFADALMALFPPTEPEAQLVCRVRDLGNGPKIYIDGKTEPHHWVWVRDTIRNQPLSREWRRFDIPVTPTADVRGCGVWIRVENKPGTFEARNMRVVGSDGSVHPLTGWHVPFREHQPYVTWSADKANACGALKMDFTLAATHGTNVLERRSLEIYSNRKDFKKDVTYRIQMEVRADGIGFFRPAIHAQGDSNYHCWLEELPLADEREMSSGVQVALAGRGGANFVTYMTPSCWFDGEDDFSAALEQARRLLRANPKALLVPRIQLDVPPWWFRKHPEDKVVLHDGTVIGDRHGNISSEAYRRDVFAYLAKYIRALQEAFPRNFAGVHPGMQNTAECFYPESWSKMCGYDPHTLREWRKWLKAKGAADWATAVVPTPAERRQMHGNARVFDVSDPVQARCVEFARFQQAEMVRFIRDTCRVCREATDGKKLVLIFYGYAWEFASVHQGPAATGHYGVGHLLETIGDGMDIVSAPLSYDIDRRYLGSTPIMHAAETFMRHGILPVYEDDSRTHLDQRKSGAVQEGVTMNAHETIEMLTRNKGVMVVRGFESWWMDLMGQGWFADADIWKICRDLRKADLANCRRPRAYAPPVALIHDEESILRIEFGGKNIFAPLSHTSRRTFARTGAGFGQYLLSDAVRKPLDAKLEVHLSSWALTPQAVDRLVADRAARPDVTRVWCWMPGCLTDHGFDAAVGSRLTGLRLRRAAVNVPRATATAEGLAVGLPDVLGVSKDTFRWEAGSACSTLLTVEPTDGDRIWAIWPDGTPAIVARQNAGGSGWSVFYGVNVFDVRSASALVRAAGVFSHFADVDGKATLSVSDDLVVLQQLEDGRRDLVFPQKVRLFDVRENRDLGTGDRFSFDLRKGDVKVFAVTEAQPTSR